MKLEIYNQKPEPQEEPVRLAFERHKDGTIRVIAVDEHGERVSAGYLIDFNPDGTIERQESVSHSLGFKLDSRGRIRIK